METRDQVKSTPAPDLPAVIRIGCKPSGTDPYAWAVALARVIGKYAGIPAVPAPHKTGSVIPQDFQEKKLELGLINTIMTHNAARGLGAWQGNRFTDARFIASLMNVGLLTVAVRSSGIKTMADIKGKRFMCEYVGSSSAKMIISAVMNAYGLSPENLTVLSYESPQDVESAIKEHRTDAAIRPFTRATPFLRELALVTDLTFVSLDDEVVSRLCSAMPVAPIEVPPGSYRGQDQPWKGAGPHETVAGRAGLQDELVFAVVSAIYDHFEEYLSYAPTLEESRLPKGLDPAQLTIPVHAGAVKYYKEKGWWTKALDDKQNALLKELSLEK